LIISGGIGLAPLRPVLYHIIQYRADYGKVALLYGARTPDDILYIKELEKWRSRFDMEVLVTVDRAPNSWRGNVGVVTRLINRTQFDPLHSAAFICGPEIMMRFSILELQKKGVAEDRLFISMERNMKCGVGLCGHCQLGPTFVCKDGPVYKFTDIKDILLKTKPETLWYLLNTILKNSTYIRWQLVHVARKFGAIKKDFDFKNIGAKKLFTIFENSLILDEAIDKIIWDRMDIENTQKILKEIQEEKIKIHIQGLSPISLAGLETIRGLMVPQRADRSILMALKKRLEDTNIVLVCVNCNKSWSTVVRRVDDKPKCPNCGAIKISVLGRRTKGLAKLLTKKQKTKEEEKELRRLHKNASLTLSYGKPAVLVLVGRGIGPDTASRILRKYNISELLKSEEHQIKLLRDILKAELTYARTRGFWDN